MEAHSGWKWGPVSGKNTEILRIRDQAKAQMELNLPRDFKNKKGFYKYIGDKRKTKENMGPLPNETGNLIKLNVAFAPDLIIMTSLQEFHFQRAGGRLKQEICHFVRKGSGQWT